MEKPAIKRNWIFYTALIAFIGVVASTQTFSQFTYEFNALLDVEFSTSNEEDNSSSYQSNSNASLAITQFNLINKLRFGPQWEFNARFLLDRDMYDNLKRKSLPQLNVHWVSKKRKMGLTLGSFINPFGLFNQSQLSTERTFVNLPLSHSYFTNISDKMGYVENLTRHDEVLLNGKPILGSTNLNYGGYSTGLMMSWNIKPGKLNWKVAVVNGASAMQEQLSDPLNFGVISRLKYRPNYFWEQGLSLSYGSYMVDSEIEFLFPNLLDYRQTIIGTDFTLGKGFFEISGEIMAVQYSAPKIIQDSLTIDLEEKSIMLKNLAGYIDLKYEPPFLQGSYLAYRVDHIGFGDKPSNSTGSWADNVIRHSLAFGYHINRYLLVRLDASTQSIDNEWSDDEQYNRLRISLTAHN